MKGIGHIKFLAAALLLAFTGAAQSGAYAKFDGKGEIIGLFNLSGKDASCSDPKQLSGSARNVRVELREPDIAFSFTFVSSDRRRFVGFSLKDDIVPRADIEKLLSSNGKERITVTACLNGGQWTAREITRQSR